MTGYKQAECIDGVKRLQHALDTGEEIVGHNIIAFDLKALSILYPWFRVSREQRHLVIDTLVMSRLLCPDLKASDFGLFKKGELPGECIGSHTLEAVSYTHLTLPTIAAECRSRWWACH